MVVIRLARRGAKKQPFYHITAADRRAPRDGRYIEKLGYYNPIARGQASRVHVDFDRVDYWVGQGARLSETTRRLIKEARLLATAEVEVAETEEATAEVAVEEVTEESTVSAAEETPSEADASATEEPVAEEAVAEESN